MKLRPEMPLEFSGPTRGPSSICTNWPRTGPRAAPLQRRPKDGTEIWPIGGGDAEPPNGDRRNVKGHQQSELWGVGESNCPSPSLVPHGGPRLPSSLDRRSPNASKLVDSDHHHQGWDEYALGLGAFTTVSRLHSGTGLLPREKAAARPRAERAQARRYSPANRLFVPAGDLLVRPSLRRFAHPLGMLWFFAWCLAHFRRGTRAFVSEFRQGPGPFRELSHVRLHVRVAWDLKVGRIEL